MSLINEALKRTRDAAYQPVHTPPPGAPEYRLESDAESSGSKSKWLVTIVIVAVVLAGIVGLASRLATHPTPMPDAPRKAEVASPPVPAPEKSTAAPAADAKVSEDQIVAKVMEKMKAEQPAAVELPKLVLQGITYAKEGSDAMINGVTVHEGEDIEGARVVTIENRRVKLDFKGQEIILRLP